MEGLTERAADSLSAILHTEPDDPEVVGATSAAVVTPDAAMYGARLSPDSVLGVLPPSLSSKPLASQPLRPQAGSRVTAPSLPPPHGRSSGPERRALRREPSPR